MPHLQQVISSIGPLGCLLENQKKRLASLHAGHRGYNIGRHRRRLYRKELTTRYGNGANPQLTTSTRIELRTPTRIITMEVRLAPNATKKIAISRSQSESRMNAQGYRRAPILSRWYECVPASSAGSSENGKTEAEANAILAAGLLHIPRHVQYRDPVRPSHQKAGLDQSGALRMKEIVVPAPLH